MYKDTDRQAQTEIWRYKYRQIETDKEKGKHWDCGKNRTIVKVQLCISQIYFLCFVFHLSVRMWLLTHIRKQTYTFPTHFLTVISPATHQRIKCSRALFSPLILSNNYQCLIDADPLHRATLTVDCQFGRLFLFSFSFTHCSPLRPGSCQGARRRLWCRGPGPTRTKGCQNTWTRPFIM